MIEQSESQNLQNHPYPPLSLYQIFQDIGLDDDDFKLCNCIHSGERYVILGDKIEVNNLVNFFMILCGILWSHQLSLLGDLQSL